MLRRHALAASLACAAAALAACGSGGSSAASGSDGGAAAATRTVEHAMGTTEVPADVVRVVALDTGEVDAVVSLGLEPVGVVTTDVASEPVGYLGDALAGAQVVGTIGEPDFEAVAALEPDLVVSNVVRDEANYERLSAIAPTVMAADVGDTWRETLELVAEATGREERAEELLAAYDARAGEVGAAVGAALADGEPADVEVSVVRFLPGQVRLYGQASFIGTVLDDAGFARPASQRVDDTFVEVSQEQVDLADGDVVFTTSYGDPGETPQAAVTGGPLWQGLPAVRAGRAFEVDDDVWMLGIGVTAAGLVLDDVERLLVP